MRRSPGQPEDRPGGFDPEPEPLYDESDLLGSAGAMEFESAEAGRPGAADTGGMLDEGGRRDFASGRGGAVASSRKIRGPSQSELNQLWGSVFFAADRPPPKRIVVTSAMRHEGATQIATALAMTGAGANSDMRVCLVDANLRHPRIAALLELEPSPGLSEIINGRSALDQALHAVAMGEGRRTLGVLTAGGEEEQALSLLRSRQLKGLMGALSERFDHVIIDAPAANIYPDPQILSSLCDGVVLVVQAGRTRRESVAEAKKRLEMVRARVLGVVLNQRTYPIPGFLYRNM